jgi:AbiU2
MRAHQGTSDLPKAVSEIFVPLRREIGNLHGYWHVFQSLFQQPETLEAVKISPGTFYLIRVVFRHQIIMGFSRITDPKSTGRGPKAKQNLTIKQLLHVVRDNCSDSETLNQLAEVEKRIEEECTPFRVLRNRSIAHLDLKTCLNAHPDPLPDIDGQLVQRCLDLLARFMNLVLGHFTSTYFDFSLHISPPARNIVHGLTEFQRWLPIVSQIERKKILGDENV